MDSLLKSQNWHYYPYRKPTDDVKHLCVTAQNTTAILTWASDLGNWFNDNGVIVQFNGMYTKAQTEDEETEKHLSVERVVELLNARNSLAKHLLKKTEGFIKGMHYSPFVLPYDTLYNLCMKYEKEKIHIISRG